jgi:hypothetical protein
MEMPTLIKCLMCEIKSLQNMYIGMTIWVRVTVLNATFGNISVILCLSVLLVEGTGGPWENHWHVTSHWQTLSHNVVSSTPHHEWDSNSLLVYDNMN